MTQRVKSCTTAHATTPPARQLPGTPALAAARPDLASITRDCLTRSARCVAPCSAFPFHTPVGRNTRPATGVSTIRPDQARLDRLALTPASTSTHAISIKSPERSKSFSLRRLFAKTLPAAPIAPSARPDPHATASDEHRQLRRRTATGQRAVCGFCAAANYHARPCARSPLGFIAAHHPTPLHVAPRAVAFGRYPRLVLGRRLSVIAASPKF